MPALDQLRQVGASCPWVLRALGRGFLSYGEVMHSFVSFLIMGLFYWLVIPFFQFLRIGDPLQVGRGEAGSSYWTKWKQTDQTVERHKRLF